jgi:hypothetical protein
MPGASSTSPARSPADGTHSPLPRVTVPESGQHAEEILRQVGHDWVAITELRWSGALGRVGQGKHMEPTTETTK